MTISFFLTLGLLQRFDLSYLYPFQGLRHDLHHADCRSRAEEKLNMRTHHWRIANQRRDGARFTQLAIEYRPRKFTRPTTATIFQGCQIDLVDRSGSGNWILGDRIPRRSAV
jgi:hypothetical protein